MNAGQCVVDRQARGWEPAAVGRRLLTQEPERLRRILYVIDTLEVGGAERSLLEIARRLDRQRFELTVCHIYRGSALRREFEAAGVPVISLDLPGKYQFLTAMRRLGQVVRAERPDLMHTTLFRADQVGRAVGKLLGLPVVSSFVSQSYDPTRLASQPRLDRRKHEWLRRLDRFTGRWVTRFHALSEAVSESNCRALNVDRSRVTFVPRGRDAGEFRPLSAEELSALRRSLGIAGAFPCILNVGRLVDQKSQWVLIEAMRHIIAEFPSARMLIAGDGRLRGELEARVRQLKLQEHVDFLGRRCDVPQLLQAADCFAFPSLCEGMPGAVLEAMFAGCPTVASDIPVVREVLQHEQTGLLVPVNDPAGLAAAIVRLARDESLSRRLAACARQTALERFEIHAVVRQMEDLYADVLATCAARGSHPSSGTSNVGVSNRERCSG